MSLLGLAMSGVLLVASPTTSGPTTSSPTTPSQIASGGALAKHADAVWLAAHGGFLIGNAHRCGLDNERVVKAGQLVQTLIAAASRDEDEASDAGTKFAEFFLVTAFPGKKESLTVSCKAVSRELARLEQHQLEAAKSLPSIGASPAPGFRLSDGE